MKVSINKLRELMVGTLSQNFSASRAERITEVLLWADMSGIKTQGIIKMIGTTPIQKVAVLHDIKVERDTKLSQLIDAGGNPAPLVCQVATDEVIKKAKDNGFGIIGVHNTFSSNGAQAFYAERIAKEDLIGIVMSRSPASFAPFESIDPLFGTNPIGFAFPTETEPLVFDMATSAMTWYGLVLAKSRGERIPENMAIDKNGQPTTDPSDAMGGALLPFDRSYKGSGLGMTVEMLAGTLVGADYGQEEGEWGSLLMAIDPSLLMDLGDFKKRNTDLINKVKSSRRRPGVDDIRLPGERARQAYRESVITGKVEIDESILKELGYFEELSKWTQR